MVRLKREAQRAVRGVRRGGPAEHRAAAGRVASRCGADAGCCISHDEGGAETKRCAAWPTRSMAWRCCRGIACAMPRAGILLVSRRVEICAEVEDRAVVGKQAVRRVKVVDQLHHRQLLSTCQERPRAGYHVRARVRVGERVFEAWDAEAC
eukprot:42888-Chlamydomonas_euryale.AAC.1